MHAMILHLTPVLAAEKSKVPFFIAGGVLVGWALIVAVGIGMRNPRFPATLGAQRAVMAISAVLVLVAVSMAVLTSGGSAGKSTAAPVAHEGEAISGAGATSGGGATSGAATKPGAGATSVKEEADPEGRLQFTTKDLSAKAGTVTVSFANSSQLPHNMTIAQGTTVVGATPTFQGADKTLTLKLTPGTYVFYCSVPGHRAAGMEGKLTVQ